MMIGIRNFFLMTMSNINKEWERIWFSVINSKTHEENISTLFHLIQGNIGLLTPRQIGRLCYMKKGDIMEIYPLTIQRTQ